MRKRIAIIGAGPSGLALLRAFQSLAIEADKINNFPELVCYEKQEDWGGLWNYTWRTGVDKYGEAVHGSMYRYLWSNAPKECLEFADYSFQEHFGKAIPSYPPRAVLWDYIKGRLEKSKIREKIRFLNAVRSVKYSDQTSKFSVSVHDLSRDKRYTEVFDHVVVATGHFSVPNVPHFEGFDSFNGRILHSHDFRDALEFRDKDVLIVGSSFSAEDIGSQCYKYGAKSITCCHRTKPMGYRWPVNWYEVSQLVKVENNIAIFKDGTQCRIDSIILCTGYRHHFPFLTDELRLKTDNRLWPLGLYQGIFWEKNPALLYMGMQNQYYSFNMFDAQAWYARDVLIGRLKLPTADQMRQDIQAWQQREQTLEAPHDQVRFQGDYVKQLVAATNYPDFDIERINQAFFKWMDDKQKDIMDFRNNSFCSIMTGVQSCAPHTPWLEELDDSLKNFIAPTTHRE